MGMLHREVGSSKSNHFIVEKVQTILDQLDELCNSQEFVEVSGMPEKGHEPKEIIRNAGVVKDRMEQMRLIIRLANLSSE